MNKNSADLMTAAALRDLDPASTTALTEDERERADAALARILTTPHDQQAPRGSGWSLRRRGLVLVGLIAAGAVVPALLLGGGSAFATWTPKPEPLTGAASIKAATTCRTAFSMRDQGERVLIAERRGGWTYVLIAGLEAEAVCLMPNDVVGNRDPNLSLGSYSRDPVEAPALARDSIDETGSQEGSVPVPGHWLFGGDEGWISSVEGYVGSDVTGVTVHTPIGTDVDASVANGRFAAWWPSEQPSSKHPEVMGAWSYTVTLADGSTRRVTG